MLDGTAIATGLATGIATNKSLEAINKTGDKLTGKDQELSDHDLLLMIAHNTGMTAAAVNPKESPDINFPMNLQSYPSEYVTDDHNFGKPHLCIFFAASTPVRVDIMGVGTYLKTVGPGWVQADVPGGSRWSTTDSAQHGTIFSYRDEAIGAAL